MMRGNLRAALVGIGGFGRYYVQAILDNNNLGIDPVAVVDPSPQGCPRLGELLNRGARVYADLGACLDVESIEIAFVATPITHHSAHIRLCIDHGVPVMCEKPLCVTIDEALGLLQAQRKAGTIVGVGYQWSYSEAILRLKADMVAGRFGPPVRFRTMVHWIRGDQYYGRNPWVGRIRDTSGALVLDSPVNNSNSHHLHNMLFLLGEHVDQSAQPVRIVGEKYRARKCENYDTAFLRIHTTRGVEVTFAVSHVCRNNYGPEFVCEFENGVVRFRTGQSIIAQTGDGTEVDYGSPDTDGLQKIRHMVRAVREGGEVSCGIAASLEHTRCMNALQECGSIIDLPRELLRYETSEEGPRVFVDGLEEVLHQCHCTGRLPSEQGVTWAQPGVTVDLREYSAYQHVQI